MSLSSSFSYTSEDQGQSKVKLIGKRICREWNVVWITIRNGNDMMMQTNGSRMFKAPFSDWPFKRKIITIIFGGLGFVIVLISSLCFFEKYVGYRQGVTDHTVVIADLMALNSSAALFSHDRKAAQKILKTVAVEEDIVALCLFTYEGISFSSYINSTYLKGGLQESSICSLDEFLDLVKVHQQSRFGKSFFDVVQPIYMDKNIIGHLAVRSDLQIIKKHAWSFLGVISSIVVLLSIFTFYLFRKLNIIIIVPITNLMHAMEKVSINHDYTLRAPKQFSGQDGDVIDCFNTMVEEIHKRYHGLAGNQLQLNTSLRTKTKKLQELQSKLVLEIDGRREVENKLAHAKKMISIGTLAGTVAHDLNNILSGVVSYPQLLLMDLPEDSKLRVPLETVYGAGKKATAIVHDLLTLARRDVNADEKVDLKKLAEEYISSPECAELLAFYPMVDLHLQVLRDSLTISGSPFHLTKMIMNLVCNATEAIEGKGTVIISIDRLLMTKTPVGLRNKEWKKGEYILLTIKDDGVGIAEKYQERIFEPFYSKQEMGRSGTGLGMTVVWATVEDHNGFVTLTSEENNGTTVGIYLPTSDVESIDHAEVDFV